MLMALSIPSDLMTAPTDILLSYFFLIPTLLRLGMIDSNEGGPFLLDADQGDSISGYMGRDEVADLVMAALEIPEVKMGMRRVVHFTCRWGAVPSWVSSSKPAAGNIDSALVFSGG